MPKPTAVVVDDDVDLVGVFCEYLRLLDVDVQGRGHDGADAVDLYEKIQPNIMFLDLVMPNHDGYFALKEIKARDPQANIVVLSGNPKDTAQRLQKLGASDVIIKPFEVDKVADIIGQIQTSQQARKTALQ
jgi:two-component system chemotaxis response regulator CheY